MEASRAPEEKEETHVSQRSAAIIEWKITFIDRNLLTGNQLLSIIDRKKWKRDI